MTLCITELYIAPGLQPATRMSLSARRRGGLQPDAYYGSFQDT